MRALAKVLVPLLLMLALLAWGATALLTVSARSWFERDVAMRAQLAVSGARDALGRYADRSDRGGLSAILEEIGRDERIMAVEACGPSGPAIAQTRGFPQRFGCDSLRSRQGLLDPGRGWRGGEISDELGGEPVHVSVVPVRGDEPSIAIVLVHDMSFMVRREAAMRHATVGVFIGVALLASLLTVLMRRVSWRSWTEEFRRLLALTRSRRSGEADATTDRFGPLVADLREAFAELAKERESEGVRWSGDRLHRMLQSTLDGDGVVVVANREPYVHERTLDGAIRVLHPASGLVTALEPIMRACSGTWIAHGSGSADRETVDDRDHVRVPPGEDGYLLRRLWIDADEERGYYYGFANEGLWPLCHIAYVRPTFHAENWRQYQAINERFADAVAEEAHGRDPIVLVQDYHFALVPQLVRQRLPHATVLTFWHIPWPNAESFGVCPYARELLTGLLSSSILGFHTQLHCNNFLDAVDRYLEARIDREAQAAVLEGRPCLVRRYPISIEWPSRWASATPPAPQCRRSVFSELGLPADALLGVGVDRLDYTKGIEERLQAVGRALERFPHLRGRFTFAQLAAPSRTAIERYRVLSDNVEALAAQVNERFASGTYRPIVLLRAHHEPLRIFEFLKAADVCYVSSLHDGMNLVAKEFVAAREDERGVLVLSRFTGAARELTEALIVNPHDVEEASAALATALAMPAAEQAERMRAMRTVVAERNVFRWAGSMLLDAARVRQRGRLSHRLSMGLRTLESVP